MKNSTYISKCKTCGEYRGFLMDKQDPSSITRGFCRCESEGWELCSRHEGHVRRRFRTVKITGLNGSYRYFSVYSMLAPCRKDTCFFTPTPDFLKSVAHIHEQVYTSL